MRIQRFYAVNDVAKCLGVKWNDVLRWVKSPTPQFPLPVAVLGPDGDKPLWASEQIPELRTWLAERLNLSDPAVHWARVDGGGEAPGGHEDQMDLFPVEAKELPDVEPDSLFTLRNGAA